MTEVVWQRDDQGRMVSINARVEEVFGLSHDRVMADPGLLAAAIHPDDRDGALTTSASAQGQWDSSYRIVRPDGELRWIEESGTLVAGGDEPTFTVGTARDVTDSHARAIVAQEKDDLLQAVLDNGAFGVVFLNARDEITQANDVFAELSGYEADSMVGMALDALLDSGSVHTHPPMVIDGGGNSAHAGVRMHLVSRDGTTHVITVRRHAMRSNTNATDTQLVIVQDITELENAGKELVTQARFDQHTGLAGRSYFGVCADVELRRAQRSGRARRHLVDRPRRVQGGERPLRPSGRRHRADRDRYPTPSQRACRRCRRPPRWRRVRRADGGRWVS